jgi:hypothetical protein
LQYDDYFQITINNNIRKEIRRKLKFLGYGEGYDRVFNEYTYDPNESNTYEKFRSSVYVFLKYPEYMKAILVFGLGDISHYYEVKNIIPKLRVLLSNNQDTEKDLKLLNLIARYQRYEQYTPETSEEKSKTSKEIIKLVENDEFDIIDIRVHNGLPEQVGVFSICLLFCNRTEYY